LIHDLVSSFSGVVFFNALLDAQLGAAALITAEELLAQEITIFNDRVRIDVQTLTPGLTFAEARRNRQ